MQKYVDCKDCLDRHVGCHAECDKYKAYKERKHLEYKESHKDNRGDNDYIGYVNRIHARMERRKRWRG